MLSFIETNTTTLDKLKKVLDDAYYIKDESLKIVARLEDEYLKVKVEVEEAKQKYKETKADVEATQEQINEAEQELIDWERVLDERQERLYVWKHEWAKRNAISYCTAFETFLREFLIERLLLQPTIFESFLRSKWEKTKKEVKYKKHQDVVLKVTKNPLEWIDIDECLTEYYPTFQSLEGKVNEAYNLFLKKMPFGEIDDDITNKETLKDALQDIKLLFQVRHKLIHRSGQPDNSYGKKYMEHELYRRLNSERFPDAKEEPPLPVEILTSPAISSSFNDKMEEFADSLEVYASYILATCQLPLPEIQRPIAKSQLIYQSELH